MRFVSFERYSSAERTSSRVSRRGVRVAIIAPLVLVLVVLVLFSRRAEAYPWMIRHDYTGCATCHTDPSGSGLLTPYGRAQAALLLSSPLGSPKEDEPGSYKEFAFGALPLPEGLDLQAWLRGAYLANVSRGDVVDRRFLLMRADVGAHLHLGALRASAMLGGATEGSAPFSHQAWVTHATSGANLVSREHWIGAALADDAVLVRAGRLEMPYGLRNVEHTMWVRSETRTDTDQDQQHGVAVAYTGEHVRGELMAILGNYQISPDAYRERGYSLYAEYAVAPTAAIGLSSLVTHAEADPAARLPVFRQAHGAFARFAPVAPLVLLAEADVLVRSVQRDDTSLDVAALVQADYEPVRGLHLNAAGEVLTASRAKTTLLGGWLTAWMFLFAHTDARIDLVERTAPNAPATTTVLLQLHGYL